jgi:hypothetical protein
LDLYCDDDDDGVCDDSCAFARDGECDDGERGAQYIDCACGSDCGDCGVRSSCAGDDDGARRLDAAVAEPEKDAWDKVGTVWFGEMTRVAGAACGDLALPAFLTMSLTLIRSSGDGAIHLVSTVYGGTDAGTQSYAALSQHMYYAKWVSESQVRRDARTPLERRSAPRRSPPGPPRTSDA